MGRDAMSVVDGQLKVYGVDGLRIADASILPRVTTGNTMSPCVVIGEMAAAFLRRDDDSRDWLERQSQGKDSNAESVLES
jgi:choline dehydrogenase